MMKWGTLALMLAAGAGGGLPGLAGAGSPGPDETAAAPYPSSPVIAGIEWAPPETIVALPKEATISP